MEFVIGGLLAIMFFSWFYGSKKTVEQAAHTIQVVVEGQSEEEAKEEFSNFTKGFIAFTVCGVIAFLIMAMGGGGL